MKSIVLSIVLFLSLATRLDAALGLDGFGHSGTHSVTLTTTNANDIIVAVMTINASTASAVSSANTTGWTLRLRQPGGSGDIEYWTGIAASPLTAEVITASLFGDTFFVQDAFGISGADTAVRFDSNGALPVGGTTSTVAITTSNANDFLVAAYRVTTAAPTAGAGWTLISGADFQLTEYKIVTATQSGTVATIGTGNGTENGGLGDAIIAASACTPSKLAFTAQPSNAAVGASLGTVTVNVQNAGSVNCTTDTSTITIANKAGTCTGMTLSGTASGANAFTTTNLAENTAGACTLHATDGALTAADSNAFTISAGAVTNKNLLLLGVSK